jgi:hypothetical protein
VKDRSASRHKAPQCLGIYLHIPEHGYVRDIDEPNEDFRLVGSSNHQPFPSFAYGGALGDDVQGASFVSRGDQSANLADIDAAQEVDFVWKADAY